MSTRGTLFQTPTIEVDQDKYDNLIRISERYNQLMKSKREVVKEIKTKVEQADIEKLLEEAEIDVKTILEKCTVVTVKLKNGFILTRSSACVDPKNYDEDIGKKICIDKIKDQLWELEGYKLQDKLYKEDN